MTHIHQFVRIVFGPVGLTRWRCSCGLRVNSQTMALLVDRDRRDLEAGFGR